MDPVVLRLAYAAVSFEACIACAGAAAARGVTAACWQRLAVFPHPVHDAADGRGQAPGLRSHHCDLLATLHTLLVDGVLTGLPLALLLLLLLLGGNAAGASMDAQCALRLGFTGAAFVSATGAVLLTLTRGEKRSICLLLSVTTCTSVRSPTTRSPGPIGCPVRSTRGTW